MMYPGLEMLVWIPAAAVAAAIPAAVKAGLGICPPGHQIALHKAPTPSSSMRRNSSRSFMPWVSVIKDVTAGLNPIWVNAAHNAISSAMLERVGVLVGKNKDCSFESSFLSYSIRSVAFSRDAPAPGP